MIPVLETERLVLRAPRIEDVAPYVAILTTPRAAAMGGPFDETDARLDFMEGAAGWALRGYGMFSIERRADGAFLGIAFVHHEEGDPEREIGWVLTEAAEGHGYAAEAARAARDYVFGVLGWDTVVSYVHPSNERSVRLAARLGAVLDDDAERPVDHPDCLVYRHPRPAEVLL